MLELLPAIIVLGVIALVVRSMFKRKVADRICTSCGSTVSPKSHTKGSIWIEIVLWLAFIIPGLIYSIWRLSSKQDVCPVCKKPTLIPLSSPAGQKYAREFGQSTAQS